jgi:hypothetical protein
MTLAVIRYPTDMNFAEIENPSIGIIVAPPLPIIPNAIFG